MPNKINAKPKQQTETTADQTKNQKRTTKHNSIQLCFPVQDVFSIIGPGFSNKPNRFSALKLKRRLDANGRVD